MRHMLPRLLLATLLASPSLVPSLADGPTHPPAHQEGHAGHAHAEKGAHAHGQRGHSQHEHGHHEHPGDQHGQDEHESHGHSHGERGMHHDFSDAEHWATVFDEPERDAWQKPAAVLGLMEVEPGATVADLGAGTGYFLPHLAAAVGPNGRVLGLDVEVEMVRYMEERARREGLDNVQARAIAADDPGLEEGSVDRLLIVNTWHHIDSRGDYAAKLSRALAPGGALFVVDFTRDSPEGPPLRHRLPPEKVRAELEQGGLATEQVEADLPRQYVIRAWVPSLPPHP